MLSWCNWKWCDVIWTDEKIFHTEPQNQRITVKILFDEDPDDFSLPLKQQGGEGVMFYCAVLIKGKIYFDVPIGIIASGKFTQFLENSALPSLRKNHGKKFQLQQDNAPPHKKHTIALLKEAGVETLQWPPQSLI